MKNRDTKIHYNEKIRPSVFSGTPLDFPFRALRFAFRKLLEFPFRALHFVFRKPPGIFLARFLLRLLPVSYQSYLYHDLYTQGGDGLGWLGAIFHPALNWKYYSMSEDERRRFMREAIWGGQAGKEFHDYNKQVFQGDKDRYSESESFLKFRRPLIRQISELLSSNPNYHTICEIGTGHGMFLDCLSKEFPNIKRFVGIDLNRQQILDNKETYKNSKLEFVHAEITDWVNTQCEKGTFFVMVNVLEYFSQQELQELLELIHNKISPVAIAISEPLNIDLNSQVISKPREGGAAYSHNYPYYFKQYGYVVFRQELQHVNPSIPFYDEVIMLATA